MGGEHQHTQRQKSMLGMSECSEQVTTEMIVVGVLCAEQKKSIGVLCVAGSLLAQNRRKLLHEVVEKQRRDDVAPRAIVVLTVKGETPLVGHPAGLPELTTENVARVEKLYVELESRSLVDVTVSVINVVPRIEPAATRELAVQRRTSQGDAVGGLLC